MGKVAASKKKQATPASDGVEQYGARMSAKQMFIGASLDMGWRLALMVLIPIFIGVQLDKRFNTEPSYTLAALFIAIAGACVVVSRVIKQVNKSQNIKGKSK